MIIRSAYNYDRNANSLATGLLCEDDSLALQSEKEQADINVIVRDYGVTGKLPITAIPPSFGDFTGVNDYQTALNALIDAEENFMSLPSEIRKRFDNDPSNLIDFLEDPTNLEEARKIGLIASPEAELEQPLNPPTKELPPEDSAGA